MLKRAMFKTRKNKVTKEKSTSKLVRELIQLKFLEKCSAILLRIKRRYNK